MVKLNNIRQHLHFWWIYSTLCTMHTVPQCIVDKRWDAPAAFSGCKIMFQQELLDVWITSYINSSPPSIIYIHCWTGSSSFPVMAFTSWVPIHYLNRWWLLVKHILITKLKNIKITIFQLMILHLKLLFEVLPSYCPGEDELNGTSRHKKRK